MKLSTVHDMPVGGSSRLSMQFQAGRRSFSFEHRVSCGPASESGDAALAASLLPAMRWGGTLEMDAPVSPRLLSNLDGIEHAFLAHSKRLRPVKVVAPPAPFAAAGPDRGVACFFSGGVDSFYSVLRHRDEITHLVFVHGFDIPLAETGLRERVSARLRLAAAELGLPLIEVETSARPFAERHVDWDREYYGPLLASVALFLSPMFRKVYIASTFAPDPDVFSASSPGVDPLWSTVEVEIVHDTQAPRIDKVAAISRSPVALRHLRVCWENRGGAYNCGRCRKCLLAMACLRIVGALDRCEAFPVALDLQSLARVPLTSAAGMGTFTTQFLGAAEAAGDLEVADALRRALRRATKTRRAIDTFTERVRGGLRRRLGRSFG
jgi:hypothetical protein